MSLMPLSSPLDPTCNVNEVSRLLWTVLAVVTVSGVAVAWRPTWRRVAGLAAFAVTWAWIDMEGPVLVSSGTHGIHVADLPVIAAVATGSVAAVRLALRRRRVKAAPA